MDPPDMKQKALEAFCLALTERWESEAQFLTFLETELLAADAVAHVVSLMKQSKEEQSKEERKSSETLEALKASFHGLLDAQVAVMTVRGEVRNDFLNAMYLSRK
mmetsp:Transcript_45313/g.79921  ORF Transcript_45313/g.79921 Transcript_45313/m.79921 type:complete len:105 (+) Transcript_45313:141-455(+)